ncbi:MAG TPA: 3-dehydroquinate synthase [Chthoniobacterales bacterium]|jgi:3-dehydroquinate synthase|nr:3-dehydroquinate synthase [Chthoniobacterales bacterium]
MRSVQVRAGQQRYEVLIGRGLLGEAGTLIKPILSGARCAVIADANVASLFGEKLSQSLSDAGFAVETIVVDGGESAKSMAKAAELCQRLTELRLDRRSFLLSLGGGVVGDLAGFVAAIYLRGIRYVSLPTTLLAQIDSCVGGKTGVNLSVGKNLIGAFHHPSLVLADTDALQTLPERIWKEGFAEAIKHGIIRDAELFYSLGAVDRRDPAAFIARNIALKAGIVEADERERNDTRSLLNFGHTIGHAIEYAAGYGNILHGEAISLGILAAAHISIWRAGLSLGEVEKIRATLESQQLPTKLPRDFPRQKIFEALPRDKKFEDGRIRFVVAHAIGRASMCNEVTMPDLEAAIAAL